MAATTETIRRVKVKPNYDHIAWKWMRYSALLLIPLVWFHVISTGCDRWGACHGPQLRGGALGERRLADL